MVFVPFNASQNAWENSKKEEEERGEMEEVKDETIN